MRVHRHFGHGLTFTTLVIVTSCISTLAYGRSTFGAELSDPTIPPSAPLVLTATFEDGHVNLSWEASQPGHFAIHSYHILRKSDSQEFVEIAQNDASSTTYTDTTGHSADTYEITASDDQDPVNTSPASDAVVASNAPVTTEQPSVAEIQQPSIPSPTLLTKDLPSTVTTEEVALPLMSTPTGLPQLHMPTAFDGNGVTAINHSGEVQIARLDEAVRTGKNNLVIPLLAQYDYEKQQLYEHFRTLGSTDKAAIKQSCEQQSQQLETSLLNLSEDAQMSTIIALASCHLIEDMP